jgi:hypothetical protein
MILSWGDPVFSLGWAGFLALIAVFMQALEDFRARTAASFPAFPDEREVNVFFGSGVPLPLKTISIIRMVSAILAVVTSGSPWAIAVLLVATLLSSIRYLGLRNGGSDAMTQVILIPLLFVGLSRGDSAVVRASLYWIGIQGVLSYFFSGLRKARNPEWWNGSGLETFLRSSRVSIFQGRGLPPLQRGTFRALSIGGLFFEILFPLSLLSPRLCSFFLGIGVFFHLGVFLLFGLNRFFWIWLACYPAILFMASRG